MNSTLVSVCILCYNHEKYIAQAIESVLNQTYKNIELVIVDNGSTDNSPCIIESYAQKDHRIKYFPLKVNTFVSYGINYSIKNSSGEYICCLAGDDYFEVNKIEVQLEYVEKNNIDVCFTWVKVVNDARTELKDHSLNHIFNREFDSQLKLLETFIFEGNTLCATSLMIKRSIFAEFDYFDNRLLQYQDFDLWLKIVRKYPIIVLTNQLSCYRVRDDKANLSLNINKSGTVRCITELVWVIQHIANLDSSIISQVLKQPCNDDTKYKYLFEYYLAKQDNTGACAILFALYNRLGNNFKFPSALYDLFLTMYSQFDMFNYFYLQGCASQIFITEQYTSEFNEEYSQIQPSNLDSVYTFNFNKHQNICKLRFDPIDQPAKIKLISAVVQLKNRELLDLQLTDHNGDLLADNFIDFKHRDPQLIFFIPKQFIDQLQAVTFTLDIIPYNKWETLLMYGDMKVAHDNLTLQLAESAATISSLNSQNNSLNSQLAEAMATISSLNSQNNSLNSQLAESAATISSLNTQLFETTAMISSLLNSHSWVITKPFRWLKRHLSRYFNPLLSIISKMLSVCYVLKNESSIIRKTIFNIRYSGLAVTWIKIKGVISRYRRHYISPYKPLSRPFYHKMVLPAQTKPLVSIVIPVYNQWDYTYNCIYSILTNTKDISYEVILADDNSTDETINAKSMFDNIIYIKNKHNLGFLKNCNNATKHARGEFIVFLNNDTQVMPNWLEELVDCIIKDEKIGLVGSKLVYQDGRLQESGGIVWQDGSAWNYGRLDDPHKPEYGYVKEVDYISGASIMVRASLWYELGGFDERYMPAYCEDSDFCFALRKLGYKVVFNPFSVVVHFEGISHGTNENSGIKHYQVVNKEKFKEKWKLELQKQAQNPDNLFLARDRSLYKKTILVIDHYVPAFDKDAGSRTMLNFLEVLCDLGFNVKFIPDNFFHSEPYTSILQKMGIEVLYGKFYSDNWQKYIENNEKNIEYILLSRSRISQKYLSFIKQNKLNFNILYYGHDLGFVRLEQLYDECHDKKLLPEIEKKKNEEKYMYKNADISFVCSLSEQDLLAKLWPEAHTVLIPAFFFNKPQNINLFSNRDGMIFVGGFSHYPNTGALMWFLDNVYSHFDQLGVALRVVGSNIPHSIFNYKNKFNHLEIFLNVSDAELLRLYNISKVSIVPLRQGAGVKGKVIEAMSYGIPTVGTSIAYDGLPNFSSLQIPVCNDPESFIAETLNLLENDKEWDTRSNIGLRYIEQNFSRNRMYEVFKSTLNITNVDLFGV